MDTVLGALSEVFGVSAEEFRWRRRDSPLRGVSARMLDRYSGLTQRATADVLGVGTGAAVSVQMRKVGAWVAKDRHLRREVEHASGRLDELQARQSHANA